jgi:hypothetical protein
MAIAGSRTMLKKILPEDLPLEITGGDTRLTWSANNEVEVENARRTFDTLIGKGYSAYRMVGDNQGERITAFDRNVERMILLPRQVGG